MSLLCDFSNQVRRSRNQKFTRGRGAGSAAGIIPLSEDYDIFPRCKPNAIRSSPKWLEYCLMWRDGDGRAYDAYWRFRSAPTYRRCLGLMALVRTMVRHLMCLRQHFGRLELDQK